LVDPLNVNSTLSLAGVREKYWEYFSYDCYLSVMTSIPMPMVIFYTVISAAICEWCTLNSTGRANLVTTTDIWVGLTVIQKIRDRQAYWMPARGAIEMTR
jgi:hypothetical protein